MALLLVAAGLFFLMHAESAGDRSRPVGLFTSLPILWQEAGSVADMLRHDAPPHWALAVLEERGPVRPLDTLAPLPPGFDLLVLAQPRPLSAQENVALDNWVRGGGRLLLFADPMLTFASSFSLGDKRRPEDMAMLSPILARWGLELQFDEAQSAGERELLLLGGKLPVNLPGRFAPASPDCKLLGGGIAVQCRIGRGRVLAIADAALLEPAADGEAASRRDMLEHLLKALASAE